jgi:putative glycosyltransferase (TIGR04372 family)
MGHPQMKPLPRMRHVVDYVHTPLRSDWMDVFCLASCRFFLGDTSGPFNASFVFGVPCALANFIAIGHGPYSARDVWIPKRYRSVREDRDLTFPEMFRRPLRSFARTEEYEAAGIAWVNNTPEEIRELTVEMLDRLEGRLSYSPDDERLQQQFQSLVALEPLYRTTARVGRDFLQRYAALLAVASLEVAGT